MCLRFEDWLDIVWWGGVYLVFCGCFGFDCDVVGGLGFVGFPGLGCVVLAGWFLLVCVWFFWVLWSWLVFWVLVLWMCASICTCWCLFLGTLVVLGCLFTVLY